MRLAPNAAVRRFALVVQTSLAVKLVALLVLLAVVAKLWGGQ
jgi:hypothetical protein